MLGHRITEARRSHGWTLTEYARLCQITTQALSNYEQGIRRPNDIILDRLAFAAGLAPDFFLAARVTEGQSKGPLFFRAIKNSRRRPDLEAQAQQAEWLAEMRACLARYVAFPVCSLPELKSAATPSMEELEALACQLRRALGMGDGPIHHLCALVEGAGVALFRVELEDSGKDAFSCRMGGVPHIFLGINKQDMARSRFDLAHELAHMVLHGHYTGEDLENADLLKRIEKEANAFAGFFLMPRSTFGREVAGRSLNGLLAMKARWGTSAKAMIAQQGNLGLLDEKQLRSLYVQHSAHGWTKKEPQSDTVPGDRPALLAQATELLRDGLPNAYQALYLELPFPHRLLQVVFGENIPFSMPPQRPHLRLFELDFTSGNPDPEEGSPS